MSWIAIQTVKAQLYSQGRDIPAAFVTEYGIELPVGPMPAIDDVNKKTPPSSLAFSVGKALRSRWRLALQLTDHIYGACQRE